MLILAMLNLERGGGWMTAIDLAYFVVLGITILARVLDFQTEVRRQRWEHHSTSADLRRYVPGILLVGLAVWRIANLIGNRRGWHAHPFGLGDL